MDSRTYLLTNIQDAADWAENWNIPHGWKRRDRREPGRREKEQAEDKLYVLIRKRFRAQRQSIMDALRKIDPMRAEKADLPVDLDSLLDYDDEDDWIAELMALLSRMTKHGIDLFRNSTPLQINWALTNTRAAEWARKYVYDLVKEIDDTTRSIIQDVISAFVETPGMTLGDVADRLPFDEVRSQQIAITETTRAYSKAMQQAGDDLKAEFPDVRVIDTWYTNNDDIVCPLCGDLDGKEVEHGETFYEPESSYEDGHAPRHVGCRCWEETTTALAELD